MRKKDSYPNNAKNRERLALIGLAADRETATEPCPDDERFAEFLEADPVSPEQQSFVNHLAACESCRQKWLVLSEELGQTAGKRAETTTWFGRRGLLSLVGSACALAAGLVLYLSIDYRPGQLDGTDSWTLEPAAEALRDQGMRQAAKSGADTPARKKSEVEKLAEADAPASAPVVISDHLESRAEFSAESPKKQASAPAESHGKRTRSPQAVALHDEEGFAADTDVLELHESLKNFIDSFSSLCESREAGEAQSVDFAQTAEQGRALLELEKTMEIPYKEFIGEIVQLPAQKEPVNDTQLDRLCTRADKVAAEIDKGDH